VSVGDEIEVKILRVDIDDRKIGLSRKLEAPITPTESGGTSAEPREELKGGMGDASGPLFSLGGAEDTDESGDD